MASNCGIVRRRVRTLLKVFCWLPLDRQNRSFCQQFDSPSPGVEESEALADWYECSADENERRGRKYPDLIVITKLLNFTQGKTNRVKETPQAWVRWWNMKARWGIQILSRNANTIGPIFRYFLPGRDRSLLQAPAVSKCALLTVLWRLLSFPAKNLGTLFSKEGKPDCDAEKTSFFEDLVWLSSFVQHSSPLSITPDNQNSLLCHCQCREISVQAMNIPSFSRFSTEKQGRTNKKKWKPESKPREGRTFLKCAKNEPSAILSFLPRSAKIHPSSTNCRRHWAPKDSGRPFRPTISFFICLLSSVRTNGCSHCLSAGHCLIDCACVELPWRV